MRPRRRLSNTTIQELLRRDHKNTLQQSFTDTEFAENLTQQVIRSKFTSNTA